MVELGPREQRRRKTADRLIYTSLFIKFILKQHEIVIRHIIDINICIPISSISFVTHPHTTPLSLPSSYQLIPSSIFPDTNNYNNTTTQALTNPTIVHLYSRRSINLLCPYEGNESAVLTNAINQISTSSVREPAIRNRSY